LRLAGSWLLLAIHWWPENSECEWVLCALGFSGFLLPPPPLPPAAPSGAWCQPASQVPPTTSHQPPPPTAPGARAVQELLPALPAGAGGTRHEHEAAEAGARGLRT
jgi:hypothetical protein